MATPPERYWVYASGHLVGPYEADEIQRLPVFTADLPLCPEPLLGTPEERWSRAADVPALSDLFPPTLRTPEGTSPPKVGPWPPDAELRADALATARLRMEVVDRSLEATQRRLNLRKEAYEKLKRDLAARVAEADGLNAKVRAMSERLGGFLGIEREHELARAAMAMQEHRAAEFRAQVERFEAQLREGGELNAKVRSMSERLGGFLGIEREREQTRAALAEQEQRAAELRAQVEKLGAQLREAAARPQPPAQAPAPLPEAPAPASAPRARARRRPAPDDFGLPPTVVDVPDFS